MALHPSNNLSTNISTLEMMRVIYINEGNKEIFKRIDKAEEESENTCEITGTIRSLKIVWLTFIPFTLTKYRKPSPRNSST